MKTSKQKKKQRRKKNAAAAVPTAPTHETLSTHANKPTPPRSPVHIPNPSGPVLRSPPPPPTQQQSSPSPPHPTPPKQAGSSPSLSTPSQSAEQPSTQETKPPHLARPLLHPLPPPANSSSNAWLPRDHSKTTTRERADHTNHPKQDQSAKKPLQVPKSDRATSSPTLSHQPALNRQTDITKPKSTLRHVGTKERTLDHGFIQTTTKTSSARDMAALVADSVKRAKAATASPGASTRSPFGSVVMPLAGNKMPIHNLTDRFPTTHPRLAELNKLSSGSQPYTFWRSIRGQPHTDSHCGRTYHVSCVCHWTSLMLACNNIVFVKAIASTVSCSTPSPSSQLPTPPPSRPTFLLHSTIVAPLCL